MNCEKGNLLSHLCQAKIIPVIIFIRYIKAFPDQTVKKTALEFFDFNHGGGDSSRGAFRGFRKSRDNLLPQGIRNNENSSEKGRAGRACEISHH